MKMMLEDKCLNLKLLVMSVIKWVMFKCACQAFLFSKKLLLWRFVVIFVDIETQKSKKEEELVKKQKK